MITFGCLDYCDCGDCDDYGDGDGHMGINRIFLDNGMGIPSKLS